jgi:hypothetical protein
MNEFDTDIYFHEFGPDDEPYPQDADPDLYEPYSWEIDDGHYDDDPSPYGGTYSEE